MPKYDVNVVFNPNLDAVQAAAEREIVKSALERHGATISNIDDWGNRRMAYEIQKDREASVVFYTVEMAGNSNGALTHELQLRDHIRRITIIRDRPEWSKPRNKKNKPLPTTGRGRDRDRD